VVMIALGVCECEGCTSRVVMIALGVCEWEGCASRVVMITLGVCEWEGCASRVVMIALDVCECEGCASRVVSGGNMSGVKMGASGESVAVFDAELRATSWVVCATRGEVGAPV